MPRISQSILIFVAASQIGPLLCLITQLPGWLKKSPATYDFLYQLIQMLWPAWPIAVIEVNTGPAIAGITAAAANALPFACVGGVMGLLGNRRATIFALFLSVGFVIAWHSSWASGGLSEINTYALTLALIIYAAPFYISYKIASAVGRKSAAPSAE
jgi:hypothetical protein